MKNPRNASYKAKWVCFICWAILVLAASTWLGCATVGPSPTLATEDLLVQAGFKSQKTNTPQNQDYIKTLPQRQVVAIKQDTQVIYVFADAKKNTLYIGSREALWRFQDLVRLQQRGRQQQQMLDMLGYIK
ncbi:MAG: hypothetical protein ACLP2P_12520 [Desulfobaccales bacterium]